jgi:hypothetical protein
MRTRNPATIFAKFCDEEIPDAAKHDTGTGPVAVVAYGVRNDVNLHACLQVVDAQYSVAVLDGGLIGFC